MVSRSPSSKKSPRSRKTGYSVGRWTPAEHRLFLDGLKQYGREWKKVATMITTRSSAQIRSHAQKFFAKMKKEGEENRVGTPHGKSMHRAVAAPGSTRRPFSPNTINAGVEDSEAEGRTGDANEFRLHQDELERLETKLLHLLGCRRELVVRWSPKAHPDVVQYTSDAFNEQIDILDEQITYAYVSAFSMKCAQGHVRPVAKALLSFIVMNQASWSTPYADEMAALHAKVARLPKTCCDPMYYMPSPGSSDATASRRFKLLPGQSLSSKGARMTLLSSQCAEMLESGSAAGDRHVTLPGMDASEIVAVEVLSNQCTPTHAPMQASAADVDVMPSLAL